MSGAAPVSLESYVQQVRQQSVRNVEVHPPEMQRAFAHLVLDAKMLRKLGTALNSGTSIFLYGPTGAGKTTIATALSQRACRSIGYGYRLRWRSMAKLSPSMTRMFTPRFDGVVSHGSDERWVLCHRPDGLGRRRAHH